MLKQWNYVDTSALFTPVEDWPWGEETDAMEAAWQHHRLLFENEEVRILEVTIPPGEKEELHTHRWKSVFIVDSHADMRYFGTNGEIEFERKAPPAHVAGTSVTWKEPEGLHAIENTSATQTLHGIRIEIKN